MPASSPLPADATHVQLGLVAQRIRERRKSLRISAASLAEAAGMSRVTLHRIEAAEPSVTMGAYLNAMTALGMVMEVRARELPPDRSTGRTAEMPEAIRLADYPQLQRLAWHLPGISELTPTEALGLYERNWRHLDASRLDAHERELLDRLVALLGKGHLLV